MSHDTGYKELFSHPEFVEALLDGFVPHEISCLLDYSTLSSHPGHYITPLFHEKIEDAVWSLQFKVQAGAQHSDRLYLYILLEFQSSVDQQMPLRMLHYSAAFYHQLIKQERVSMRDRLPLVFPLVLYNGQRRWTPPCNMLDMLHPAPAMLQRYQPQQEYFLLDVSDCQTSHPSNDNLLQLVFNVENARTAEGMQQVAWQLANGIRQHPQRERIDRVLTRWFKRFLHQNRINIDYTAVETLQEIPPMLANRIESWFEEWKQQGLEEGRTLGRQEGREEGREEGRAVGLVEGRQEGREEGREEGRAEGRAEGMKQGELSGRAALLEKQLRIKFNTLDDAVIQRLHNASPAELDLWAERILFANKLEDIMQ